MGASDRPFGAIRQLDVGQFVPGVIRDRAAEAGDPLQVDVVEGDQHTVSGEVDVGLEIADAELVGVAERGQGVLRRRLVAAAVGEHVGAGEIEVGVARFDGHVRTVLGCSGLQRRPAAGRRPVAGTTLPAREHP